MFRLKLKIGNIYIIKKKHPFCVRQTVRLSLIILLLRVKAVVIIRTNLQKFRNSGWLDGAAAEPIVNLVPKTQIEAIASVS